MNEIKVLDCTLRDGGYINDWNFKKSNISMILNNLRESNLDVIECGFLSNKNSYDPELSIFDSIERMKDVLPKNRGNSKFVCMVNFGEYNANEIPICDGSSVDGIRIAFHKKDLDDALELCRKIAEKGYMTFIQPMVTINYSDRELLKLAEAANEFNPYALYIADSFGVMNKNDLLRIFYLFDHNVNDNILLGYHAHNNLQLAYSNAQALVNANTSRIRIIDSSVFGMGRGAGNLNTELFVQHLNESFNTKYLVYPLLQIIDDVLNSIYVQNYWGYSLPHYLSASYNCHPNYASYLSKKNTLTIKSIQEILGNIPLNKRSVFSVPFIENLYLDYQAHSIDDSKALNGLREEFSNKEILVISPGSSIESYHNSIMGKVNSNNIKIISVNFMPERIIPDYIFVSNEKRYEQLNENVKLSATTELILSSNIKTKDNAAVRVDYLSLLNNIDDVRDNSTLMLLKLLKQTDVNQVNIAGFDGYGLNKEKNYVNSEMSLPKDRESIESLNKGISKELLNLSRDISLKFITPTLYRYNSDRVMSGSIYG